MKWMDKEDSGGKYVENREEERKIEKSKEQVRKCFCKGIMNDRR